MCTSSLKVKHRILLHNSNFIFNHTTYIFQYTPSWFLTIVQIYCIKSIDHTNNKEYNLHLVVQFMIFFLNFERKLKGNVPNMNLP